jgi:aminopeptidase N
LALLDGKEAFQIASELKKGKNKGLLASEITNVFIKYGDETAYDDITDSYEKMPLSQAKVQATFSYGEFLAKVTDLAKFKRGVDLIVDFKEQIPASARPQFENMINGILQNLAAKKAKMAGSQEMIDYVNSKLPKQ